VSIYTMTFTATPRPRSASTSVLLSAGTGRGMPADQARWAGQPGSHVEAKPRIVGQGADIQVNPIVNRDRFISAAKPGSPPRGNPR
jgi:hypothetical protein